MYTAFISAKGCIVQGAWDFSGELPTRQLVRFCPVSDPMYDEFVDFCKAHGWM